MIRKQLSAIAIAILFTLPGLAATPQTGATTIHIQNMHCPACAQKIAGKLYTVPSVVGVKTNYQAGIAVVAPQQQKTPSPRALWEAVEKAGFKPVKLEGPTGIFTKKPTS